MSLRSGALLIAISSVGGGMGKPIGRNTDTDTEPDWTRNCAVCGNTPILPATGMCGPCTFGEADTINGDW